jgi:hypothetical protein
LLRSSSQPVRRGLHPDDPVVHRSMPIFICSSTEAGSCVSRRVLRYNRRNESARQEPKHAAEPFAGWSSQRLQAAVGACGVAARPAREGACEGLNPHRDRLGLPRGFVQPASI